jgi:hypothetical protein
MSGESVGGSNESLSLTGTPTSRKKRSCEPGNVLATKTPPLSAPVFLNV